jgi:hypothetical protein
MKDNKEPTSEFVAAKTDDRKQETPSRFVRMKRGGVIHNVPKNEVASFKKQGFTVLGIV